ncbi:MAG: alanine racemase [Ignavibacteriaceae bacterium]
MSHQPKLFIDKERCKRNISRITNKAKANNLVFRPHFKTHQSIEIGRWFRDEGVEGITVSSVEMANYFMQDGWNDFTIAFPFYNGMIDGLREIQNDAQIRLFVNSVEDISLLNRELKNDFKIYIEIDAGYGRSGISINKMDQIDLLIQAANKGNYSQFHGFYIHDGGTYKARDKNEVFERVRDSVDALRKLKDHYPNASTSLGDTPSASVLDNFDGINEITPGNLVFYDWMQVQIGSCIPSDVAVYVEVPFAQQIGEEKAIVHGGAVHFSKDYIEQYSNRNYGQVFQIVDNKFKPVNGVYLSALSQEHGTISGFKQSIIGEHESIKILPIHSCLTVNLFDVFHTTDGEIIQKRVLS